MDPAAFLADIEQTATRMRSLLPDLGSTWSAFSRPRRIILTGMGSSAFASEVAALRLQAAGVDATAVLASSTRLPLAGADDLVVIVSAGGSSSETRAAAQHYGGRAPTVLLTNVADSPIAPLVTAVVSMGAGPETGGVACRSFQHSLIRLIELEEQLLGTGGLRPTVAHAADAVDDLLARRDDWLPETVRALDGPQLTAVVAPAHRLSSAKQGALMLREGPRRIAAGCETGDWSHIDVYLTRTTDYRMLLLAGSPWEPELMRWCRERGSTVVAAGAEVEGAQHCIRYAHDGEDDARLLAEPVIAELVAQRIWAGV